MASLWAACRGASRALKEYLAHQKPQPPAGTTRGPYMSTWSLCRVLGSGAFLSARYPCTLLIRRHTPVGSFSGPFSSPTVVLRWPNGGRRRGRGSFCAWYPCTWLH